METTSEASIGTSSRLLLVLGMTSVCSELQLRVLTGQPVALNSNHRNSTQKC